VVNLEHQWWFPELDQADKGFDSEHAATVWSTTGKGFQDPSHAARATLRAYAGATSTRPRPTTVPFGDPVPCDDDGNEIIHDSSDPRLKAWAPTYEGRD
jgi:hypothetical protein